MIDKTTVNVFVQSMGGKKIHKYWRDKMLEQGRVVSEERLHWSKLDEKDKKLDIYIAENLLKDFVEWYGNLHD